MAENVLTHKMGPLPTWGWLAIITGGGIAYYLYSSRNSSGSTGTAASTAASNVPDYVFQNYNQLPPAASAPGPAPSTNPGGTVSGGAPGTEEGGEHAGHWAVAPGGQTFAQLAKKQGLSWKQLANAGPRNAKLTKQYSGKKVPKGTRYWVPGTKNRTREEAP